MTVGVQAIETYYNGYRFRSRLEARWAVFFDALGVKYEYEPQGYDLGTDGWYLPDFWLPKQRAWVEIKWRDAGANSSKCAALAKGTGFHAVYVAGTPFPGEYDAFYFTTNGQQYTDEPMVFALGRRELPAVVLWLANDARACALEWANAERAPLRDCPPLNAAYLAARQARFEFGENGARLPAIRAATPPPAVPPVRRVQAHVMTFEMLDGQFGTAAIRWMLKLVDAVSGEPCGEIRPITSTRLTPKSKAYAWATAFLGRPLLVGEKGRDICHSLVGATAYADLETSETGKRTLTHVSADL